MSAQLEQNSLTANAATVTEWLEHAWEESAIAGWQYITDPANAATIQGLSAVVVALLTLFIVFFMRRQTTTLRQQTDLQERQSQIQSMLTLLEYAPIIAAEFDRDYDSTANRILLKNGGRAPAHSIRGHLWVRTAAQTWNFIEVKAQPSNLNAGDSGEVRAQLEAVKELRPTFAGAEPRHNDRWVLHYGDMLGCTWHTTCNIDDEGRYLPLGYFRSWSPAHWSALPEDTRKLCVTCLRDEVNRAAADRVYGEESEQTPSTS